MTFDESNAHLTQELAGRRIDYIVRKGKELIFVCTCGHQVVLQADVNGDIHFKRTDVSIVLPGVEMFSEAGKIG